jgi:hypothetical protein
MNALGLDANLLPLEARFTLAQDAKSVVDRTSGAVFDTVTFARKLFSKEIAMDHSRLARLARDQAAPKGVSARPQPLIDQDPDGGAAPPDADEMIEFVKLIMSKMPDQQDFIEKLGALLADASNGPGGVGTGDGLPANNKGALDRRRGAHDHRPAQDSNVRALNHQNFLQRFPVVSGVDVWR